MSSPTNQKIIDGIIDASEMIKRHAEERLSILQRLADVIEKMDENTRNKARSVDNALNEIFSIKEEIQTQNMTQSLEDPEDYIRFQRLSILNEILKELEDKEKTLFSLQDQLRFINETIDRRDEVITILQNHGELDKLQNMTILAEIQETQEYIDQLDVTMATFDSIAQHDPRLKALNILNSHPQGISKMQLIYMLEITSYEAKKIIKELEDMEMIVFKSDNLISLASGAMLPMLQ